MDTTLESPFIDTAAVSLPEMENYAIILQNHELKYTQIGQQFIVGKIQAQQGWLLHLSIVLWQIPDALRVIVPILMEKRTAFRIPIDKFVAKSILDGTVGIRQIGKIVRIYPESDAIALQLAQRLITAMDSFKGPRVLTDLHLGSVVYTRYGSFQQSVVSPITGLEEKYMKDDLGQSYIDPECIPFSYPAKLLWPFRSITPPTLPRPKNILNYFFKPTSTIKASPRGNVFKGIYHRKLFQIKPCIIKQGIGHMASEESGRDIFDRLLWQRDLHNELSGHIPIPRIYDFFKQGDDHYLAMEFIDGKSLMDQIVEVNFGRKCWFSLSEDDRSSAFSYLRKIIDLLSCLHHLGYVHRDLAPGNFIIDKKGEIYLIDIELAYSLTKQTPLPPFELGTPGFMSPEQRISAMPTAKEDIYGLGALILVVLTGFSPIKFYAEDPEMMIRNLTFFLRDKVLSRIITSCLNSEASERPTLEKVRCTINKYVEKQYHDLGLTHFVDFHKALQDTLTAAIKGLVAPIMTLKENTWYFKFVREDYVAEVGNSEYIRYPGLYGGLSGVLYVVALCHRCGFDVCTVEEAFRTSWKYLKRKYLDGSDSLAGGLYNGITGIGIAGYETRKCQLMPEEEVGLPLLENCLFKRPEGLDVSKGIAGQGVALLRCFDVFPNEQTEKVLEEIVATLINAQQKDGSWDLNMNIGRRKSQLAKLGLSCGISGITWFLLAYGERFDYYPALQAASRCLDYIVQRTHALKDLADNKRRKEMEESSGEGTDLRCGILATIIKAYQVLSNESYKSMAEASLLQFPEHLVENNFSQANGLSGLGELYLEAFEAFQNELWKKRAQWIADVLIHTAQRDNHGHAWWLMDETYHPTADLMTGVGGIIHFLLRCYSPKTTRYRLLL